MAFSQPVKDKTVFTRLKPFFAFERFQCSFVKDGSPAQSSNDNVGTLKWETLDAKKLGVAKSMISLDSWKVVECLKRAGFDAYLVGGCVRDLLIKRVPKDFDIITTATLQQVRSKFSRAIIVGRRFPVCNVRMKESMVEVTSFGTAAKLSKRKQLRPSGWDKKDITLLNDCMRRDFTINSLYYDPFGQKIFAHADAMGDLRSMKLRTITPAHLSFKEDQARILRGLRLAARLNLSFSKETESAIYNLSTSVAELCKDRLSLELNYMLSYGAAESSLVLLKKFKLLEILLPFQASYLSEHADDRLHPRHLMLMKLFFNLDRLVTCDRPCSSTMWVALLSFHLALVKNPQNILVVLTFASLLHYGVWENSINFARQHAPAAQIYLPEILDTHESLSDDEIAKRVTKLAVQVNNSVSFQPHSGLVCVSRNMKQRVEDLFGFLTQDVRSINFNSNNKGLKINYRLLKEGHLGETRFVLGHIIMETLTSGSYADIMDTITSESYAGIGETLLKEVDTHEYQKPKMVEVLDQIQGKSSLHLRKVDSIRKHDKQSSFPDSTGKTGSNKNKSTHVRKFDSVREHENKENLFPESAIKTRSSTHLRKVKSIRKHENKESSFPNSAGIVTDEDRLGRKVGSDSSDSVGQDMSEIMEALTSGSYAVIEEAELKKVDTQKPKGFEVLDQIQGVFNSIRKHDNKQSSFPDSTGSRTGSNEKKSTHVRNFDSIKEHENKENLFPESANKTRSNTHLRKDNSIRMNHNKQSSFPDSVGMTSSNKENGIVTNEDRSSSDSVSQDAGEVKTKTMPSLSGLFSKW